MMLIGRIVKDGRDWIAECDAVGAITQGKSREDARFMLANCIETLIGADNFDVTVDELETAADGSLTVIVRASRLGPLAARVLKHQREQLDITQEEAAKRARGDKATQGDWAIYERGERVPSIEKYAELLAAVAPDYELVVVERKKVTR